MVDQEPDQRSSTFHVWALCMVIGLPMFFLLVAAAGGWQILPEAQTEAEAAPERVQITGIAGIDLGSSFETVLDNVGANRVFNAASLQDCFDQLPTKGCQLFRADSYALFTIEHGIPFTLSVMVNDADRVTDVTLGYERENNSAAECRSVTDKAVDWVTADYGALEPRFKDARHIHKTASGATYPDALDHSVKRGQFLSLLTTKPQAGSQRYVRLLAHYLDMDDYGLCTVNVTFAEPETVRRPVSESDNSSEPGPASASERR